MNGLFESEIEQIADYNKMDLDGVIASDELSQVAKKLDHTTKNLSFILNTARRGDTSRVWEHWYALYIDRTPDHESIEIYDPLVQIGIEQIEPIVDMVKENIAAFQHYPKLKINRVKIQPDNSSLCGYLALDFLKKRQNGESFKQASRFENQNQKVKEQIQQNGKFEVIFA